MFIFGGGKDQNRGPSNQDTQEANQVKLNSHQERNLRVMAEADALEGPDSFSRNEFGKGTDALKQMVRDFVNYRYWVSVDSPGSVQVSENQSHFNETVDLAYSMFLDSLKQVIRKQIGTDRDVPLDDKENFVLNLLKDSKNNIEIRNRVFDRINTPIAAELKARGLYNPDAQPARVS